MLNLRAPYKPIIVKPQALSRRKLRPGCDEGQSTFWVAWPEHRALWEWVSAPFRLCYHLRLTAVSHEVSGRRKTVADPGTLNASDSSPTRPLTMTAKIIDGKRIGQEIREEVRVEVARLRGSGLVPGLAAVLVGDHPASRVYVRNKIKACQSLGVFSQLVELPEQTTTSQLLQCVSDLNRRTSIHGILVQLPLPRHVDEKAVLLAIDPAKDVDGLHPTNAGALALSHQGLRPCTPSGVMEILHRERIPLEGARAVVIGRSNLVGKPLGLLLLQQHATVTFCHSRTRNLAAVAKTGDILVAAVGKAALVTADFVKPGAVVVDVGINRVEGAALERLLAEDPSLKPRFERNRSRGIHSLLVGDVNFSSVSGVASALTPVPGGVGPLTIALLMKNTVQATRQQRNAP